MPFLDFNQQHESFSKGPHDFTIIGCGAVGIHLALLLSRKGHSVLILESGKVGEHAERQSLNDSIANRPDIKSSVQWGRKRALGGTTIRWGGQSLPFQPLDFENRPWLEATKWPLEFAELEPHYRVAETYLGVGTEGYFTEQLEAMGIEKPFASAGLEYHVSRWAPEPNMFKRHQRELNKNVDILYNAHCTAVTCDNGSCQSVTVQNYRGEHRKIQIKELIIATGGVESVRFLTINRLSDSPVLGKGFMEHPCMDLGTIVPKSSKKRSSDIIADLQRSFGTRQWRNEKFGMRLSLSPEAQQEFKLSNASASLMFKTPTGKFDPLEAMKDLLSGRLSSTFVLLRNLNVVFKAAYLFLRHGFVYKPNAVVRLTIMCEQLAGDGSTLDVDTKNLDAFGQPKLNVNWVIGESSWKAAMHVSKIIKDSLELSYDVDVVLRPELQAKFDNHVFSSVNHHMGGAVMGTKTETSVVSPELRVHDLTNVYVCSASVFPSSSHSNPTLTALALGGRMVQHLT